MKTGIERGKVLSTIVDILAILETIQVQPTQLQQPMILHGYRIHGKLKRYEPKPVSPDLMD